VWACLNKYCLAWLDVGILEPMPKHARLRVKSKSGSLPPERILACALREFSRHGYAGARMDRIADGAKISKRMLFYYFKSKRRLFQTVIDSAFLTAEEMQPPHGRPADLSPFWSAFHMNNPEWTRLLGWEGLEWKKGGLSKQKERRKLWKRQVERFKKSVNPRDWPRGMNTSYIFLGLVAMEIAPVLLPNLAHLILGENISENELKKGWTTFMRAACENLQLGSISTKRNR
jgi:AcrR family transcriptional regulator